MSERTREGVLATRRGVLAAVGAGGTVGVAGLGAAQDGAPTAAVHDVEMLVAAPPTNPERPADFFYQPTGLHVQPGDVVRWTAVTPDHNVVSYHPAFGMDRRMPAGADPFASPLLGWKPDSLSEGAAEPPAPPAENGGAGGENASAGNDTGPGDATGGGPEPQTWLHSFEVPGVYDVLCSPHEEFGMAMRVVVGDEVATAFETNDATALPEPRAGPAGLARTTLTDPQLRPPAIVDAGSVAWQDLAANESGEA